MTFWLRSLLIVTLALFAAPRVMAADGERAVICAADGSRLIVLFDFETGKPVEKTVNFETCDHCLTPPMTAGHATTALPNRMDALNAHASWPVELAAYAVTLKATARAPPLV